MQTPTPVFEEFLPLILLLLKEDEEESIQADMMASSTLHLIYQY